MSISEDQFNKIKGDLIDVVSEKLGAKIVGISDEWFAAAENLIKPGNPIRDPTRFTPAGKWYDGWETRRHNSEEADYVIIESGVSSRVQVCEVDTAFFNGNHAPFISVEGANEANPSVWDPIIEKIECGPSQRHFFATKNGLTEKSYTHFRLRMYPDGGIARFRLYGKVTPSLSGLIDTAFIKNGGVAIDASDNHFSPANNILLPGRGHDMLDGWETKRSRTPGHVDWVIVKLAAPTNIDNIIVDTAHYKGNFPQKINVKGFNGENPPKYDSQEWTLLVPDSKTGPDQEHHYNVQDSSKYTHVILTIIPDGGIKRLRVFGTV